MSFPLLWIERPLSARNPMPTTAAVEFRVQENRSSLSWTTRSTRRPAPRRQGRTSIPLACPCCNRSPPSYLVLYLTSLPQLAPPCPSPALETPWPSLPLCQPLFDTVCAFRRRHRFVNDFESSVHALQRPAKREEQTESKTYLRRAIVCKCLG
jgi:hypothetical protein